MRVVGVGEVAVARAAVCAHEGVGGGVEVAAHVGDPAAALELDAGILKCVRSENRHHVL